MPSYWAFRQIKIRHIFIMQFGGYFVKFYSRQIFRPYGTIISRVSYSPIINSWLGMSELCRNNLEILIADDTLRIIYAEKY